MFKIVNSATGDVITEVSTLERAQIMATMWTKLFDRLYTVTQ